MTNNTKTSIKPVEFGWLRKRLATNKSDDEPCPKKAAIIKSELAQIGEIK